MRLYLLLYILLVSLTGPVAIAQSTPDLKAPRILILLDESSSMISKWGDNDKRYEVADRIILNLMDSVYKVNDQVEFSLRVFGHQYTVPENNCFDTKNEVMFSKDNYTQMSLRLANITPLGVTPIAYALKEAAENDLGDEWKYAYSIVLITDGGESCGGNICDVVKTLLNRKINFKPYIVSLVDYAPLRTEYDCLGNYLQVTANKDIPGAVSTIVQSYRPMLRPVVTDSNMLVKKPQPAAPVVATAKPKPLPVVEVPKPQPKIDTPKPVVVVPPPIVIPPPAPEKQTITKMELNRTIDERSFVRKFSAIKTLNAPKPILAKIEKEAPVVVVTPPVAAPVVEPPAPTLPPNTRMEKMARSRTLKALSYFSDEPIPVVHNNTPKAILAIIPADPAPVVVAAPVLKPAPPKPPVTKKPAKPAITPGIVPATPTAAKVVPFTTETIDAKETTVEIYLTDGKGKFYNTSPQITVQDPPSGSTVKQFYRTLDATNKPDAQPITEGNYNIVMGGKSTMIMRNITVLPNKTNKIFVVVSSGTLKFEYAGAPDRPMKEFSAVVVLRTDRGGPVIKQKCTTQYDYDPGNYFVEINTLPISRRNVDIDPGAESILSIEQPGFVQFTNENKLGNVSLYTPLGDKYARFHNIEITGNPASQKLQLQPGTYEAHFFKNPNLPTVAESKVTFNVKSNEVTEVEIK